MREWCKEKEENTAKKGFSWDKSRRVFSCYTGFRLGVRFGTLKHCSTVSKLVYFMWC